MLVQKGVLERRRVRSMPEQRVFIRIRTAELVKRVRLPPQPPLFFNPKNTLSFPTRFFLENPQHHQTKHPPPSPPNRERKSTAADERFYQLFFFSSTTCPKSALDIGCYIEPSSSTSKALDKQAFSAPQNADSFIIADSSSSTSSSTTPRPPPTTSFQTAGLLPIIFDDSSSSSTSANPEADYYLQGQNNLGQTDYYPPSLLNNNVEQAQQGFAEYY